MKIVIIREKTKKFRTFVRIKCFSMELDREIMVKIKLFPVMINKVIVSFSESINNAPKDKPKYKAIPNPRNSSFWQKIQGK